MLNIKERMKLLLGINIIPIISMLYFSLVQPEMKLTMNEDTVLFGTASLAAFGYLLGAVIESLCLFIYVNYCAVMGKN